MKIEILRGPSDIALNFCSRRATSHLARRSKKKFVANGVAVTAMRRIRALTFDQFGDLTSHGRVQCRFIYHLARPRLAFLPNGMRIACPHRGYVYVQGSTGGARYASVDVSTHQLCYRVPHTLWRRVTADGWESNISWANLD